MTVREQRRAQILTRVLEGTITLKEAALVMDLSLRQARRLKSQLRRDGPGGLVHGSRGQPSPRRIEPGTRARVVALYRGRYTGANVQHFCELLAERESIVLSVATVRRTLKAAGVKTPSTRRAPKHRSRRERMPAEGMLLQIDASPFRWLGPTGPKSSLVGALPPPDRRTSRPASPPRSIRGYARRSSPSSCASSNHPPRRRIPTRKLSPFAKGADIFIDRLGGQNH